ncbi:hypothetical protein [Paraburkholderia acidiphila]|uniref:Restriction alleviation protein, Lar family n=1 Tax=Paraburkholderia acidiphila TaxID=2571747 RepID=A0A7Z2G800_9BURK|nr:hypothetical protein [Paraburkholderia acidiphila]QGZ56732.1 hypothetical protein FAZ97_17355 [Paraburkholderia acidiphila]
MKLDPCKFCGGAPGDPRDDQIEFDSWVASIDCTGCDITITMQYSVDSPLLARERISKLWNSKP